MIAALRVQRLVQDDDAVARALAKVVSLRKLEARSELISQHRSDSDLYFILSGKVEVFVNGRLVSTRTTGCHVGEMALIDPTAPRSATVKVTTETVVAQVSEPQFTPIAEKFPKLWRCLAMELATRLREREKFHSPPNAKPSVFIGSSSESLAVAQKLKKALPCNTMSVTLWTDGVFRASSFAVEDLLAQVKGADFAILVLGQDDTVISRRIKTSAPRDNVVFELGLFMGVLGRLRTLIVKPKRLVTKIPSDLLGLTPLEYEPASGRGLPANIAPVCKEIRNIISQLGPR
ncbi:MAG: TIR domain-containing protein [Candidatus Binatia bacterium]